jgi:hypothetical protein
MVDDLFTSQSIQTARVYYRHDFSGGSSFSVRFAFVLSQNMVFPSYQSGWSCRFCTPVKELEIHAIHSFYKMVLAGSAWHNEISNNLSRIGERIYESGGLHGLYGRLLNSSKCGSHGDKLQVVSRYTYTAGSLFLKDFALGVVWFPGW